MNKTALICGSYAYDHIMGFNDHFKNHILADNIDILNVAFLAPEMRREFGGCAGNISYNLNLLGAIAKPMATVGEDFFPYQKWLDQCGINNQYITVINNTFSAQAFITTDVGQNQITTFHPGAMNHAHQNRIDKLTNIDIGIVSPDGRQAMIEHAEQFNQNNIPFIFDPGQGLPMFSGDELKQFIHQAKWLAVNDYEWQMLQQKINLSLEELTQSLDALIITGGAKGSIIHTAQKSHQINPVQTNQALDPTGCGDAYRAGVLFGLLAGLEWQSIGQLASVLGAIKVAHLGTQNHHFSLDDVKHLYQQTYQQKLAI